ncbi:GntR family transcriptional regulator [[Actinomadura] parvosata subsp. kistnae]|uniref:GntR family transcriptional regulator n=1 Tax=[Actinomadura] parvosata subsp. kistnae TaxID=1909395 RepID=A0A1V0AHY9_9ACTN|nr:PLP-dependent aminotransferase family protein [Nonomuraea sp. ATCC 55076]AQZ69803.1 GntR family transcriptional regulator [Nonomuraea sp. ATCC 55076]
MRENWAGSGVDLHLDLHLELPARGGRRRALEEALRRAVRDGRLPHGTRLPSSRALAAELRLSRGTVSAAYDQLVAEGYLTTRPGSGTEIAALPPQLPAANLPATAPAAPARAAASEPEAVPVHDLRPGQPDLSAFPARAWMRATRHVLDTMPAAVLGPCDPRGRIELRTALAAYLARTRGVLTTPDLIVVTTGFVQAINLLAQVVEGPFAMEDPGHDFYRDVVRRAGREVVPLPVDELGARTGALTPDVAAAVVTPAHQYPMGVPLHPSRRLALREWGGLVVEDDYDGEFRYDRQPVGAFQGTAPERVVYCGTTSESLGPGLRLGWMAVPPALIGPLTEAKRYADAHTEVLGQLVLARLIETHAYDRHIRAARLRYRRRLELLRARLPHACLPGVAAGLRALLLLPAGGPPEAEVLAACERAGIALRPASPLWHGEGRDGLLIGYAAPSERAYPRALEALAGTLARWEPRARPARSTQ